MITGKQFRKYSMLAMVVAFFGSGIVALLYNSILNGDKIGFVALGILIGLLALPVFYRKYLR